MELQQLHVRIQELQQFLTHSKSTLQGWLKENHKGWEETIGKLCDEAILWQTNLSPQKAEGNSFYGIQIDLNVIERHIKSIDDIIKKKRRRNNVRQKSLCACNVCKPKKQRDKSK